MAANHYASSKGVMSQQNCPDPSAFERAQYVRGLSSYTSLFPMPSRSTGIMGPSDLVGMGLRRDEKRLAGRGKVSQKSTGAG